MRALNSHFVLVNLHSSGHSVNQIPASTFAYLNKSTFSTSLSAAFRQTRRGRTRISSSGSSVPSTRSPDIRRPRDRSSQGNGSPSISSNSASTSVSELDLFLELVPLRMRDELFRHAEIGNMLEVVMDLGRQPLARFPSGDWVISQEPVKLEDLQHAISKIMLERDTGRPRGFGFLTFADRRGMEDAIREMHGSDFGERVISVNKAQPKMGGDDSDHGYGGNYSSGGRGSYGGGGDRSLGQDECFKCGRPGHWARDCTSSGGGRGGGQFSSRSRFSGGGGRGDRYADRDRFMDDRYDGGRFGDRDRYDSRDSKYGSRNRYANDRYPPSGGDRFGGDRYGVSDRIPQNGYGRDRDYDREGGPRRSSDRYGGGGGPARYEGRSYRDRAGPYDRPKRGGGRPSSFDY